MFKQQAMQSTTVSDEYLFSLLWLFPKTPGQELDYLLEDVGHHT